MVRPTRLPVLQIGDEMRFLTDRTLRLMTAAWGSLSCSWWFIAAFKWPVINQAASDVPANQRVSTHQLIQQNFESFMNSGDRKVFFLIKCEDFS